MTNIKEAIINHIDLGDLIGDILDAQDEYADDKHSFGVRVANLLNDFRDKVVDEHNGRVDYMSSPYVKKYLDELAAVGDFKLKQSKEN